MPYAYVELQAENSTELSIQMGTIQQQYGGREVDVLFSRSYCRLESS